MSTAQKKALRNHRRRLRDQGLVRLEVQASEADAPLLRALARALLHEPEKAALLRRQLRATMGTPEGEGLKALLAAAPLEGIEISCSRDPGRVIDL